MDFTPRFFDPAGLGGKVDGELSTVTFNGSESMYVYSRKIILAVNLALATERPLLVAGPPGSGKSTLARNVAEVLDWKYYEKVITSRTQARDLQWRFDALRRLSDAQVKDQPLPPRAAYVEPEVLWWSFDPVSAATRGAAESERDRVPRAIDPAGARNDHRSVVLLDEIDKAEPDVPNDLLVPLDVGHFEVVELDSAIEVTAQDKRLLILTTNGERELAPAFLRRCVVLTLPSPKMAWLVQIADNRFGSGGNALHSRVASEVIRLQDAAQEQGFREPSTAEFLDTVEACRELRLGPDSDAWRDVSVALLWKHDEKKLPAG
jgi:MoxR-like ATPase